MASKSVLQLARFLRDRRGNRSFAEFARRLGVTASTLFRLEMGQQGASLPLMDRILERLHCTSHDVFCEPELPAPDVVRESKGTYTVATRRRRPMSPSKPATKRAPPQVRLRP